MLLTHKEMARDLHALGLYPLSEVYEKAGEFERIGGEEAVEILQERDCSDVAALAERVDELVAALRTMGAFRPEFVEAVEKYLANPAVVDFQQLCDEIKNV